MWLINSYGPNNLLMKMWHRNKPNLDFHLARKGFFIYFFSFEVNIAEFLTVYQKKSHSNKIMKQQQANM